MAEIAGEKIDPNDRVSQVKWSGISQGDTCTPVRWHGAGDRTVQVTGTFGAGGTVSVEGTLDSSDGTYAQLTDPFGNAISFTDAGIDTVTEMVKYIKPVIAGGDGTTNLTVIMLFRKT